MKQNIEITDRYSALGIKPPEPGTCCKGECEGTGWVPIKRDEKEEPFKTLWLEAETKKPTDDDYHFVTCPECNGTGKRKDETK